MGARNRGQHTVDTQRHPPDQVQTGLACDGVFGTSNVRALCGSRPMITAEKDLERSPSDRFIGRGDRIHEPHVRRYRW